jgi:hypothetical protein
VKLLVPCVGQLEPVDARLIRLAEFLGVSCEALLLMKMEGRSASQTGAECLERAIPKGPACLVVNPRVMQDWIARGSFSPELASFLVSRFSHLLVHALRPVPFDQSLIAALSGGSLLGLQELERSNYSYEIPAEAKDVCEAFAGLSFGPANSNPANSDPANSGNDRIFAVRPEAPPARILISIGGRPFMAALRHEQTEIFFLAGRDIADLDAEIGDTPLVHYFSRLLPHAMALRYTFGEESWRPGEPHACVVIDDPLLRRNYGFLNFESLLDLMQRHNFHTTVAFIPHNFRRSSPQIAKLFRDDADRFSLCYHGNDHTGAEFAATDTALLNTMLQIAEQRMRSHDQTTGLSCDRVMVFPQGNFSAEAMSVLRSRNFECAVNTTPHPTGQANRLTLRDIAQPAVLRYSGFPLFLRNYSQDTQPADIAFKLFFGKPVLIVEHHDVFQRPDCLLDAVARINAAAPAIHWSSPARAAADATLRRRVSGTLHVRAYSRTVKVANDSPAPQRFSIEWGHNTQGSPVEQVLDGEGRCTNFEVDGLGTRLSVDLAVGSEQTFSLVHRNGHPTLRSLGFRRNTKAYLRRRLSEVRDNCLSKNACMLAASKAVKRRILH